MLAQQPPSPLHSKGTKRKTSTASRLVTFRSQSSRVEVEALSPVLPGLPNPTSGGGGCEAEMLQFPAMMRQWPSPPLIPASTLLPVPAATQEDELLLAMAESDLEDKV